MMSKKNGSKSKKTKERGLNVRVTQEQKVMSQEDVRVNSYFEKNDSRRKKKSDKNAKKTSAKATNSKDTDKKSPSETPSVIKKETKKPASFSRNGDLSKRKDEPKVEILLPEKPVEKTEEPTEKAAEKSAEKPVEKLADEPTETVANEPAEAPSENEDKITEQFSDNKKAENSQEFETLKLDTKITRAESKVIIRDVEKEKPAEKTVERAPEKPVEKTIERAPEKPAAKLEKTAEKKTTRKEISRPVQKKTPARRPSAKEIKQQEIEKAVKAATKLPSSSKKRSRNKFSFDNFGWTRAILAVACATTAIFAAVYFVNLTSTDMSLKVAAMQSGIEASYPSYVPRGYSLSDVTSSNGRVKMSFKNDDAGFSITEENSSWDSNALLNNFIKENYGDDYTVVREQGLTLYMGDDWEAWVNGGMLYKLTVNSGSLTKKQMKTIAASL